MITTFTEFCSQYDLGSLAQPFQHYLVSLDLDAEPATQYERAELRALLLTFVWQRLEADSQMEPGYWQTSADSAVRSNGAH